MVGRHPEPEKGNQSVWDSYRNQLCVILGPAFNGKMMSKIALGIFVLHLITFGCSSRTEEKTDGTTGEVNEYPNILLTLTTGEEVGAKTLQGKNVFMLFQPDCDHCQEEAVQIEQRLEEFDGYVIYFISSSPIEQITAFADNFNLNDKKNVQFAQSSTEGVLKHYGPIQTPSVYIYSAGKLKKSFNGQTDIENILNAL